MEKPTIERTAPAIRLMMFRFLCPLCGAKPSPIPLREYLQGWASASVERVNRLARRLESILRRFGPSEPRWVTQRFARSVQEAIGAATHVRRLLDSASQAYVGGCTAETGCVVCGTPWGEREPDRYFTEWEQACRVQTANLLYETGLILWAIVREVPRWCDAAVLAELDSLRPALRSASKAMNILECPICHRPTTHLYGTYRPFCRWCLDMSGGFGIGMTIRSDGTPELIEPNPGAARVEDADLLPPAD